MSSTLDMSPTPLPVSDAPLPSGYASPPSAPAPASPSGPPAPPAAPSPPPPSSGDVHVPLDGTSRPLARRPQLTEESEQEIREVFELFDSASSGFVDRRQLKVMIRLISNELRKDQLARVLNQCGISARATRIEYDEFHAIMVHIMNEKAIQEEMSRAFSLFDIDNSGKISFENLKQVAETLGDKMTDPELHDMIKEADLDKDGAVNENEFVRIMKKTELW